MMMMIRNGTVIDTEPTPTVSWHTDVLVGDGQILEVGEGIPVPPEAEVIDATGKIVLPGFVDTHRHTYQSALRMSMPGTMLSEYLKRLLGEYVPRFRPEDVEAAVFAGALECLDSGITTLVDWSSQVHSTPDHAQANVDALVRTGIRAVVGFDADSVRENVVGNPLLTSAITTLGFGYADEETVRRDWQRADELDCLLTVHIHSTTGDMSGLDLLERYGLIRPKTLYVHANGVADKAYELIAETGGTISVCPGTETAMDHGHPVTGITHRFGIAAGLGADAVSVAPGDMFSLMRIAYAVERNTNKSFAESDVVRMATLDGARAVGLDRVVGSLRAGKQADLIMLDTSALGMAATHDPIAAVVLSANPAVVDTVLVGGKVVKRHGTIVEHNVAAAVESVARVASRLSA